MASSLQYILQIGTRWDGSQNLIWAPLTKPVLQARGSIIVPKPRSYRDPITDLMENPSGKGAAHQFVSDLVRSAVSAEHDHHNVLLGLVSLMQLPRYFCPAGDWFYGLGERVAMLRELFDPAPVVLMISPQNPAVFLSNAWASGAYPGFEDIPPDPFSLRWSEVVYNIQIKNPDMQIMVCPVETGPIGWPLALQALTNLTKDEAKALQSVIAPYAMVDGGAEQLARYLDEHSEMPLHLHARAVFSFLKAYSAEKKILSECALPNWSEKKNDTIKEHYKVDLRALEETYGAHYWGVSA